MGEEAEVKELTLYTVASKWCSQDLTDPEAAIRYFLGPEVPGYVAPWCCHF